MTLVSLTDKGVDSLELIRNSVSQLFRNSFKGLSSAQIHRTNVLLAKLYNNLKDLSD